MNKKLSLLIFIGFLFFLAIVIPQISYCQTSPPTSTIEPTPIGESNQAPLDFLLIAGIVVGVIIIVGVTATFVVMKKRVNEKSLKKFSARKFNDWVITKFNGKQSDSTSGIDGFTEGGQPLLIKQSENVNLAEVEDFVDILVKGKAQKGTIVAFNYNKDTMEGKLKATDYGIELQMLSIYELLNKRFADKLKDIARSPVTFEVSPVYLSDENEPQSFEGIPNELENEGLKKPRVFISNSNTKVVDQVKKLLDFLHYDYAMGDKDEGPIPILENKFRLMQDCDCAIINICAVEQERRYSGIYVLNSNVLTEISASYLRYKTQVALLVERKIDLPSNLKGLKKIEYDNDNLSFSEAMELEKILANFRKI